MKRLAQLEQIKQIRLIMFHELEGILSMNRNINRTSLHAAWLGHDHPCFDPKQLRFG